MRVRGTNEASARTGSMEESVGPLRSRSSGGGPLVLNNSGLRDIISEKERELHEINEFRTRSLEAVIRDRELEVRADLGL